MSKMTAIDGNEATARIAYRVSEVIAIYPITPSSTMAEHADAWAAAGQENLWGQVPQVIEMQSEGGAAGAVHGALQAGAMSTTFTASQGLLLMIPNMYKIAGELTPAVFHVSARAIAAQGLSIFGDHGDIMAVRQTGFGLLGSSSVQEAQDIALIAHAATLEARVPFVHFFDGFRTSHEVMKIKEIDDSVIRQMIDDKLVTAHRNRALNPDNPHIGGTAQNTDVYFQGRETGNPFYLATPAIVQKQMDKLAKLTGRQYNLVEYCGVSDPEMVIVVMGSGAKTVASTVRQLNKQGCKCGVLNVRLYRPFPTEAFIAALPKTVKKIAVLDRSKEPGSIGEPLYLDVVTACTVALNDGAIDAKNFPKIVGGRYGLGSKEFTPAMVKGVFDELAKPAPKNRFTVGINDDVTFSSIDYDPDYHLETSAYAAMFYGLGSDGTVGANKNSIKIIADSTDLYAQGYFVYDSKKAGSMTVSHLRFGKEEIEAPYLIGEADFIACHHTPYIERFDLLENIKDGGIFLFNTPIPADKVFATLPLVTQQRMIDRKVRFYVIDGYRVGEESGMGRRINSIMQACFFGISNILPQEEAIAKIKEAIVKSYGKKGQKVVELNHKSVDMAMANLHEVKIPASPVGNVELLPPLRPGAPEFVQNVTALMAAGKGDQLPVSAMPVDGVFPVGTSQWEKRAIALQIPIWSASICIQCAKCAFVCPHAAIRSKIATDDDLAGAPEGFKSMKVKGKAWGENLNYIIQVSPDDCTGCGVCVDACPAVDKTNPGRKSINMEPMAANRKVESANWDFFAEIPNADRKMLKRNMVKDSQLLEPLFEFSGACPGCGETPYVKLVSQLFGDRMVVANATGCSSIYGGNLPTTPWKANKDGRGTAWSNSLFEDNAEYGLGIRLGIDNHRRHAVSLLEGLKPQLDAALAEGLLAEQIDDETAIDEQRNRVEELKKALAKINTPEAKKLSDLADYLVRKSVWIIGGDGWAYDIGYGGLDHVLASGENVNILVLDTEVYSNTGGQASKSTPTGAVAKFAASGKRLPKKDLSMIAMSYGSCFVARVALGANDAHTVKTFLEAEAFDGPSLIIAYSPCIEHGYDLGGMLQHQKAAVKSGYWPLFRYNPDLADQGKNPLQIDSKAPSMPVQEYLETENRFRQVARRNPEVAAKLAASLQTQIDERWAMLEHLASEKSSVEG